MAEHEQDLDGASGESFASAVNPAKSVGDGESSNAESDEQSTDGCPELSGRDSVRTAGPDGNQIDEKQPWAIETTASPPQTFKALSNAARTDILTALHQAERSGNHVLKFSELHVATDVDTSAGFAYHLRQLAGQFVEKSDDGYRLTYAGRQMAQNVAAGTFTDIVSGSVVLEEPCPLCDAAALMLGTMNNHACVKCRACEEVLMRLPLPPAAPRSREADELPRVFDRHNRHRLSLFSDGICPDCGGAIETTIEQPGKAVEPLPDGNRGSEAVPLTTRDSASEASATNTRGLEPVRMEFNCQGCGQRVRSPLTLTVLDHPSVVSFYDDHDVDLTERPLWNIGLEWREGILSTEPWCARVSSQLDDEILDLYLDEDGTVQATRRDSAS